MTRSVQAVLFDFAGTLFTPQPAGEWVAAAAGAAGLELSGEEITRLAERCLTAGLPGGPYPSDVPGHVAPAYARRDLDRAAHRDAYVPLPLGVTDDYPGLAEAIHERILEPPCWVSYPDAHRVVDTLVQRGVQVGLISNVGVDIRPILRYHGFEELAQRSTLSFEQRVTKPDPRIFLAALRALGAEPSETLMVGDHPEADGAAAKLGLRTLIWPMSPPGAEHGLDRVLDVVGRGRRPRIMSVVPNHVPLREEDVDPDPLRQFAAWFEDAAEARVPAPEAAALATASPEGAPSARMVLVKHYDERGFVFYTGYESRKGAELAANPRAALLFYWAPLGRQVRIEGDVERTTPEESAAYVRTRPRASQLSALASPQSQTITGREALERRVAELTAEHEGVDPPLPAAWGGFRISPASFEFWQNREDRLHDRLLYTRAQDSQWRLERLAP